LFHNFNKLESIILSTKNINNLFVDFRDFVLNIFKIDYVTFYVANNSEISKFLQLEKYTFLKICNFEEYKNIPSSPEIVKSDFSKFSHFLQDKSSGVESLLVLPVFFNGKIDVIIIFASNKENRFSDDFSFDYLKNLALKFALAIDNLIFQRKISLALIEKKKLVDKLAKQNKELIELNNMKDEFLSIASHDLRSPLSGIIGLAELMYEDKNLSEQYRNWLNTIIKSGYKQLNFINEILSVLKFQQNKLQLKIDEISMMAFLRGVVSDIEPNLIKKRLKIKINDFEDFLIKIDLDKMVQVFNNLLYNAIKFSFENGVIEIKVRKSDEFYWVDVIDYGIGWESIDYSKLFTAFTPYAREGTAGEPTTGLGLAICKNIVELHNGQISAMSPGKNKGAVFSIKMPLKVRKK